VEGKTREFTYAEDSPHALWRVFQYIYTGDYSDEASGALDCEGLLIPTAFTNGLRLIPETRR
jgi:hypothetical protein